MCRRANCLLSMPLILLSRPSYFALSVFLSMALRYGDCHLPVYVHWKSLSIICWEKSGRFLGIVILASSTALVVFKAFLMLLFIVQVCSVRKQEAQEFL